MAFPGKKDNTKYSFGDPKGMATQHEVSMPPATGKYPKCTMAQYANIEGGEKREGGPMPAGAGKKNAY